MPDERHLDLPGYPGGADILGNRVGRQFQLDAFGESLLLFAAAARHDLLDTDDWRAAELAAARDRARWTEPDAGIWEIDDRRWTHCRLIVRGRAARHRRGHRRPRAADWLTLADRIVADTAATACTPPVAGSARPTIRAGRRTAAAGAPRALPADDPRTSAPWTATCATDRRRLRLPLPARRPAARPGRRLVPLCGFLVALALHQQRRTIEAAAGSNAPAPPAGPRAVQRGIRRPERQLRGNLPQAFVHALQLEAAVRIGQPREPRTGAHHDGG